ncbi:hypothetical protein VL20_3613 [Microcystis panniformis FACHB-1757]|uniref:Uncharacterized protein n=1 Tax=Microcystis panniformis FACHB-1757 TaxID=1638788 RepID=A0A0K1S3R5_9CHRO|nr:hypothetical protein VL20_3613 [Microcystis panniformis FACHB-1757]
MNRLSGVEILLLIFFRGDNTKSCLKGIGEWGAPERRSGEKQSITWELITLLKTDLV